MEAMLRRNVIYRDWRNGIDKYRAAGLDPEEVRMNEATLIMLIECFTKNNHELIVEHHPCEVRDGRGALISRYYERYVYTEGIKITIDNSMKNETMIVVW